ncbi:MAG: DNRLRE domain-containing protein, partial [Solirubrobacterales bacterium]
MGQGRRLGIRAAVGIGVPTTWLLLQLLSGLPAAIAIDPLTDQPSPAPTATIEPGNPGSAVDPVPTPVIDGLPPAAVEIVADRTATSQTFDNGDGTRSAVVSSKPIFYQPVGSTDWQPIDLAFAAKGGGSSALGDTNTPVPVTVSTKSDPAGVLSLAIGGTTIALRPVNPDAGKGTDLPPVAAVGGIGPADVADVFPGVDLRVFPTAAGANTFLVLGAPRPETAWTFAIDAPGLTLSLEADGAIVYRNADGQPVARMPAPYAVDSTPDEFLGSGRTTMNVSYSLGKTADGTPTVTVSLDDPDWLAKAVYPVYVDPPTYIYNAGTNTYGDSSVSQAWPTANYANYNRPDSPYYYEMWLGMDPTNSTNVNYDFVRFDLSSIGDVTIDSAIIEVDPYHQYYNAPTSTTTWMRQVTASWTESGVTWNNKPAVASGYVDTAACVEAVECAFTADTLVQGWVSGTIANYGVRFDENGNGGTYWKRLLASEQGGTSVPKVVVNFHVPTATIVSPTSWTNSRNVSWTYADASSDAQTDWSADVASDAAFTSILANGSWSGTGTATSSAIPAAVALTGGTTYYWRVKVKDGTSWSVYDSSSFGWDTTAPTNVTFTAPSAQVEQTSTSYTFAWTAGTDGQSGVAGYQRVFQTAAIASADVCSTSWSNVTDHLVGAATSITESGVLTAGSCWREAVRTNDNAGNYAAWVYAAAVLVDTSAPAAPAVTATGTGVHQGAANGIVYFKGGSATTLTLAADGTDNESGIASSTFGALSATTGWSPTTASTVSGDPASKAYSLTSAAVSTSLSVSSTNKAGTAGSGSAITITADATLPTISFTAPAAGGPAFISSTAYTVTFSATDGGAGFAGANGWTLQRQKATATGGTCGSFADDGSAVTGTTSASGQTSGQTLTTDKCYRWTLDATDAVGNSPAAITSGSLLVDTTSPTVSLDLQAASDSGASSSDNLTSASSLTFDVTFSESVTGVASGDISRSG